MTQPEAQAWQRSTNLLVNHQLWGQSHQGYFCGLQGGHHLSTSLCHCLTWVEWFLSCSHWVDHSVLSAIVAAAEVSESLVLEVPVGCWSYGVRLIRLTNRHSKCYLTNMASLHESMSIQDGNNSILWWAIWEGSELDRCSVAAPQLGSGSAEFLSAKRTTWLQFTWLGYISAWSNPVNRFGWCLTE